MKRKTGIAGIGDIEFIAYVALAVSWFIYILWLPMIMENDETGGNTPVCTVIVLLITVVSVAIILYMRKKKNTSSLTVVAAGFPEKSINPKSFIAECLAAFEAGNLVHISELGPWLELSPPTLDELLRKSYSNPEGKIQYDKGLQSFIIPDGVILLITKDRKLHFTENPLASQIVSTLKFGVNDEFTTPIRRYGKGSSVDIETLPQPLGIPLQLYEKIIIEHLEKGLLDAEYNPDTQILKIESGGMEIDKSGTMRFYRLSSEKKHLKIKIVSSEPKKSAPLEDVNKVEINIKNCPECKQEIHGTAEFCPGCGAML